MNHFHPSAPAGNARLSEELEGLMDRFSSVQCRYEAAISEIETRLEILNNEYHQSHHRYPIHHMENRIKSIPSIIQKLRRKGIPPTIENALQELHDIAGVRVICSYLRDIQTISGLLTGQETLRVVQVRDYISVPKSNGYRSLHIVVDVPVYLAEGKIWVPVEIQFRTIAMDFWASLEHNLRYKASDTVPVHIAEELLQTAQDITVLDSRMQSIHDRLEEIADRQDREE